MTRVLAIRVGTTTSPIIITTPEPKEGAVFSDDYLSPSPITQYFKYLNDTVILALCRTIAQSWPVSTPCSTSLSGVQRITYP